MSDRYQALVRELERLGAFDGSKPRSPQGDLEACCERAKQLVEDTQGLELGPLHMYGVASRHLSRWETAAELFRRVTQLEPEYVDGWLELTWALDSLGRLEEAEAAAHAAVQHAPNDLRTLGNLATVLRRRGNFEAARASIDRALAVDPRNERNRAIARQIEKAAPRRPNWWSRLFSR